MANLTLKQVPDDLYQMLKVRAAMHRRSINNEAIVCLEQVLKNSSIATKQWLEEARAIRQLTSAIYLTDEDLRQAKEAGRP